MKNFISKFSLNHSSVNLNEITQPVDMYNKNDKDSDSVLNDCLGNNSNNVQKEECIMDYSKKTNNLVESILDEGVSIKGSVSTTSNIKIFGFIDGDVTAVGNVVLCGRVNGDIRAENVTLNSSEVNGNIFATKSIVQNKNSVIKGNIVTELLDISGVVDGDMKVSGTISIRSSAEIVGNIETRFISVFEGATISSQVNINR